MHGVGELTQDFSCFSLQQWVFDTSLQKIAICYTNCSCLEEAPRSMELLFSDVFLHYTTFQMSVLWTTSIWRLWNGTEKLPGTDCSSRYKNRSKLIPHTNTCNCSVPRDLRSLQLTIAVLSIFRPAINDNMLYFQYQYPSVLRTPCCLLLADFWSKVGPARVGPWRPG